MWVKKSYPYKAQRNSPTLSAIRTQIITKGKYIHPQIASSYDSPSQQMEVISTEL